MEREQLDVVVSLRIGLAELMRVIGSLLAFDHSPSQDNKNHSYIHKNGAHVGRDASSAGRHIV